MPSRDLPVSSWLGLDGDLTPVQRRGGLRSSASLITGRAPNGVRPVSPRGLAFMRLGCHRSRALRARLRPQCLSQRGVRVVAGARAEPNREGLTPLWTLRTSRSAEDGAAATKYSTIHLKKALPASASEDSKLRPKQSHMFPRSVLEYFPRLGRPSEVVQVPILGAVAAISGLDSSPLGSGSTDIGPDSS